MLISAYTILHGTFAGAAHERNQPAQIKPLLFGRARWVSLWLTENQLAHYF
jgi:hypothetical protein